MGADCHDFYIEQESSYGGRWYYIAQVQTDRDYTAFGVLAGVREEDPEHIPPRGYPEDICYQMQDHAKEGGCHSETWLTTDEMVEAQVRYVKANGGSPYQPLEYAIAIMRMAEARDPEHPVRAVFCFDS